MKVNFTRNFIKIYFWQFISIILNFAALFIVIPHISNDKELYGVYTLCISLNIFLSYADLGFIGAGKKFAAEYYAKNKIEKSNRIIGFSLFFLSLFIALFLIFFLISGFNPDLIFSNLSSLESFNIASSLFFILAFSTPIILFQQLSNTIFGIRIESYIPQRINILGSFIKILSVFYFFKDGNYDIVGYFLFFQCVNIIVLFIQFYIIKKKYNIGFLSLLSTIKFNKKIYQKIKPLAFSSLFLTFSFILYYEIDNIAINHLFGATDLAVYAVGFTLINFFRSLIGIFYSPFNVRLNHYIGENDKNKFKKLYSDLVKYTLPLFTIPAITLYTLAEPIVLSWVGINYYDSIIVFKLLIIGFFFTFISIPTSLILHSLLRLKELYLINIIIPLVYWLGILFTYSQFGILSFAFFKSVSFFIGAIFYLHIYLKFTSNSIIYFFKKIIAPTIIPIVFIHYSGAYLVNLLSINNLSSLNLIKISLVLILVIISALLIQVVIDGDLRLTLKKIYLDLV